MFEQILNDACNNIPYARRSFASCWPNDLANTNRQKGPGGGYMLARAASDIKIGQVVRAIDGPLAPIACASRTAYEACGDCKSVKAYAVRFTMVKVREAISDVLDRMTIADMVAVSEGGNVTPIVSGRPAASGRKRR